MFIIDYMSHTWMDQMSKKHGQEGMSNKQKTMGMLISGLNGNYVIEWNHIHKSILSFVWDMYK